MIRIEPIRTPGEIDPETNEQLPDTITPPDGVTPAEFRDGAYWVSDPTRQ